MQTNKKLAYAASTVSDPACTAGHEIGPGTSDTQLTCKTALQQGLLDTCVRLAAKEMGSRQLTEFSETITSLLSRNENSNVLRTALQLTNNAREQLAVGLVDESTRPACARLLGTVRALDSRSLCGFEELQKHASDSLFNTLDADTAPYPIIDALVGSETGLVSPALLPTVKQLVAIACDIDSLADENAAHALCRIWDRADADPLLNAKTKASLLNEIQKVTPGCIHALQEVEYEFDSPLNTLTWIVCDSQQPPEPVLVQAVEEAVRDGYFPIAEAMPSDSPYATRMGSLLVESLYEQRYGSEFVLEQHLDTMQKLYKRGGPCSEALQSAIEALPDVLGEKVRQYIVSELPVTDRSLPDQIEDAIAFLSAQRLCPSFIEIQPGDDSRVKVNLPGLLEHLDSLPASERQNIVRELRNSQFFRLVDDPAFLRSVSTMAVHDELPDFIQIHPDGGIDTKALHTLLSSLATEERERRLKEITSSSWYGSLEDSSLRQILTQFEQQFPEGIRLHYDGTVDLQQVEAHMQSLHTGELLTFFSEIQSCYHLTLEQKTSIRNSVVLSQVRNSIPECVSVSYDGIVDVRGFAEQFEGASKTKRIQLLKEIAGGQWFTAIRDKPFFSFLSTRCMEMFHYEQGLCSAYYPQTPAPDIWRTVLANPLLSGEMKRAFIAPIQAFLTSHGLQPEEFLDIDRPGSLSGAWTQNSYQRHIGRVVAQSISCISQLEEWEPGTASLLRKRCGIRVFGRYQPELLYNQALLLRNPGYVDNVSASTVFVTYPLSDWNGAYFGDTIMTQAHMELSRRNGFWFVISEADSPRGMMKQLLRNRRQFGPLQFAVFGAHGDETGLTLTPRVNLMAEELENPVVRKLLRNVFADNAQLVLQSCKGGAPDGVAEQTAKQLNGKGVVIYSSNAIAYVNSFSIRRGRARPTALDIHFSASRKRGNALYNTTIRHKDTE